MERIRTITHTDRTAEKAAREQWDSVAKPLGSLGVLEDMIAKIAAVQGSAEIMLHPREAVVFCADNGVVCEGVTQSDSEITAICAKEIAEGRSNINAVAATFGASVTAVDLGICRDIQSDRLIRKKIAYGTKNIAEGAAMTAEEARSAISVGIDCTQEMKERGVRLIACGEMGIGNTTTSAALAAVLLNLPPRAVTGRGAGLDSAGLERKIAVVERAIAANRPDPEKPVELLAKLGGLDIAGMTGLFLGGAVYRIPVVIDGVISAVAALLACKIEPKAREYMLASHASKEPAGILLLEKLGLMPPIRAELRLGEGTGAAMLFPLLDGALSVYRNAHRFEQIGMERYERLL